MPDKDRRLSVPPPPKGWAETAPWDEDPAAQKEVEHFSDLGDIERVRTKSKVRVHSVLSYCIPISIIVAFSLFLIGIGIYAWHLFTPWHWLDADQLKELHTILFSSAVGAVVSQGAKRYLD